MLEQQLKNKLCKEGCINLINYLTDAEFTILKSTAQELLDYPEVIGGPMKYFECSQYCNEEILNRVEYFLEKYEALKILVQSRIIPLLEQITSKQYLLFKEKINFKMPGAGGFKAHQDAPAFKRFSKNEMLIVMIPLQETTINNGCLHIANYFNYIEMPHLEGQIPDEKLQKVKWIPIMQNPKDIFIFSSYLIHKSEPNITRTPRWCYFLTFNLNELGDMRTNYFTYKRGNFPPRIERLNCKKYQIWQKNLSRKIF